MGVEIHALRGTTRVHARKGKDVVTIKGGHARTFTIMKDAPITVQVAKDSRATAQSTTGIVLLFEYEDADGFVHTVKLKPPLKEALRAGTWTILAPSVA